MQVNITNELIIDTERSSVIYVDSKGMERTIRITKPEANIIIFLNDNRGEMISKDQLIDIGWNGRITGSNSLNVAIYNLRRCLSIDDQIQLENIPKLGYRLNVIESAISDIDSAEERNEKRTEGEQKNKIDYNKLAGSLSYNSISIKSKAVILIILNLLLFKFILTTYLNLVWIECKSNIDGEICYSSNYSRNDKSVEIPQGISVISNNHYYNKK